MSIAKRYVFWAYGTFLGRLPEDEGVVENWARNTPNVETLVHGLMGTEEFRRRSWNQEIPSQFNRMWAKRFGVLLVIIVAFAVGYSCNR